MGLFRSEEMRLYQMTVPKDNAWNVVNKFGDMGQAQFIDLNKDETPYNLPYTAQVKACEEAERKLAYLREQCNQNLIKINPPKDIKTFMHQLKLIKDNKRKAMNMLVDDIQKDIKQQEQFTKQQNLHLSEAQDVYFMLKDKL